MELKQIPINRIRPDPNQPRGKIDNEELKNLAITFKTTGVINPLEIDTNNIIITGERRWRAAKIARIKTIPCKVIEKISNIDRFERQVIENMQHQSMLPLDEAKAFKKLLFSLFYKKAKSTKDKKSHTKYHTALSRRIGISETQISNRLKLLDEPEFVQKDIEKSRKKASYYQESGRLKDKELKLKLNKQISQDEFKNPLDVREVVKIIKEAPKDVQKAMLNKEITTEQSKRITKLKTPQQRQQAIQEHKNITMVDKGIERNIKHQQTAAEKRKFDKSLVQAKNWVASFRGCVGDSHKQLERTIKVLLIATKFISIMDDKQKERLDHELEDFIEILERAEQLSTQIQKKIK